jgi:glutathione S-transferase
MITLYVFGPAFLLPDPSPFVIKTDVQLKMSGLPYRQERGGFERAPKGKVPYIEDGGQVIGDSTFIRDHIERRYGADLDRALTAEQRARAWTIERMLEDHLYWAMVHERWMNDANFAKGPAHFFDGAPDAVRQQARDGMRATLRAQVSDDIRTARSPISAGARSPRSRHCLTTSLISWAPSPAASTP